ASTIRPPTDDGTAYGLTLFTWPSWTDPTLLTVGLLGAVMTAFYMFRLYFLTFWGEFRGWKVVEGWKAPEGAHGHDAHDDHGHEHESAETREGPVPHESPWQMHVPLIVLGIGAIFAGFLMHPLDAWLEPVFAAAKKSVEVSEKGASIVQPLAITAAFTGM